ncbi:A24 family peptidase [Corticibacter populi]|uniref:A24 family peptidase n=1 Tax=Corticibacter populi TaxID=1550736 RepID=UPI0010D51C6E|nr:prepilin peptidase [Corticibacter populi]RZS31564.1 prepilin peptidase CpaA [Corticibacter populi]
MTCIIVIAAIVWTSVTDLLYRRISNRIVATVLLLWMARTGWLLTFGTADGASLSGLLPASIVLVAGYLLFSMGWMGAGDVKLMAVLCLWMNDQALIFLIATALAGGLLALCMPVMRHLERALALALIQVAGRWPRLGIPAPYLFGNASGNDLPYGLAIAAGAGFTLWLGS